MSSAPGKTAPRLIQDLLTYDPCHEQRAGRNLLTDPPPHHDPSQPPRPAVPARNCRHNFMIKHDQSVLPIPGEALNEETVYKVASFCENCLYHVDVTVDYRDHGVRKQPCPTKDRPLHHFVYRQDRAFDQSVSGLYNGPRTFRFHCSSLDCPVELRIRLQPPRLTEEYIHLLTDKIELRRRLESARQIDPDRQDHTMARPVDGLDFLSSYLRDSLNPTKGKGRIPLLNRKFLVTFGKHCDDMLRDLGFTSAIEKNGLHEEFCWYLPKPPPADPLAEDTLRTKIEDALVELSVYIANRPQSEKQGVRNVVYLPKPSIKEIERALGYLDYSKISMSRAQAQNAKGQEDHPYYAGLGALGDFSDTLLLFSYSRQVDTDPRNSPYYFECLQDLAIGRKSNTLGEKVQLLASEGQTSRKEIAGAYTYFGIDNDHVTLLSDDVIIGKFKSRMSDSSPAHEEESRQMLRVIGHARGSPRILQEASNAIETYSQAISWLDLSEEVADEFVLAMFALKTDDNPGNREIARKAVEIIANHRNSHRLRQFLKDGTLGEIEMDTADAYSFLGIADRSGNIDPSMLEIYRDTAIHQDNKDPVKANLAFDLISREKGSMVPTIKLPPKYPLDTWPVGCRNTGNTCYLNSVLQFLFTVKPLRDIVLNFEEYRQECTEEAIKDKKVGRRAVTLERVRRAQEFMHELKKLFLVMITAPSESVTPEKSLVILALLNESQYGILESSSTDQPMQNGTDHLPVMDGRPVYGPLPMPKPNEEDKLLHHSGSSTDVAMTDAESAATTLDPFSDPKDQEQKKEQDGAGQEQDGAGQEQDGAGQEQDGAGQEQTDTVMADQLPAAPSHPPPPVPPRPKAVAQEKSMLQRAEAVAQQQDAAEILNNIFDLIRCAMKPEGLLEEGEQKDRITDLFFARVKMVQSAKGVTSTTYQLQDNILASPGDCARHIYRALDDEFDLQPVEGMNGLKYEEISQLPPMLMINVRRLIFDKEKGAAKRNESHLRMDEVLYFDRYLEQTSSLSSAELLGLREKKWEIDKQRRTLEERRSLLKSSELGTNLAEAADETSEFLNSLQTPDPDTLIELDNIPVPLGVSEEIRNKAEDIRKEQEGLDKSIEFVEETINSYFEKLKDHPYRLQAVFIHRGSAAGGHYYIYIHDFKTNIWRKYNDETVEEVTDLREIFEQEEKHPGISTGMVYVKNDAVKDLVEAVKREPNVPDPLPPAMTLNADNSWQYDQHASQQDIDMVDAMSYGDVQYIDGVAADVYEGDAADLIIEYIHLTDEKKKLAYPFLRDELLAQGIVPPGMETKDSSLATEEIHLPSMEVIRENANLLAQAGRDLLLTQAPAYAEKASVNQSLDPRLLSRVDSEAQTALEQDLTAKVREALVEIKEYKDGFPVD